MPTRRWGPEQLVSASVGIQGDPTVTTLAGGGFVVAWVGAGATDPVVRFQIYDAAGLKVGPERSTQTGNTGDQTEPAITAPPDGGFYIIQRDHDGAGQIDVVGQLCASMGVLAGTRNVIDNGAITVNPPWPHSAHSGRRRGRRSSTMRSTWRKTPTSPPPGSTPSTTIW